MTEINKKCHDQILFTVIIICRHWEATVAFLQEITCGHSHRSNQQAPLSVARCRERFMSCVSKFRGLRFHSFPTRKSIFVVFQNLQILWLPYAITCVLWHFLCLMTLIRMTVRYGEKNRQNPSTAGESQKLIWWCNFEIKYMNFPKISTRRQNRCWTT